MEVGDKAQDFALPDHAGRPLRLYDLLGSKRAVVLAFFPLAFSGG